MKTNRHLLLNFSLGILAYGIGLIGLNYLYEKDSTYNFWLILLPCLPIIYISTVIIRYVSSLDEMKQKITIEAMAFSGLATSFTCFSYLFLRDLGAPEFRAEWAFYLVWLFYIVGLQWSKRRF